MRLQVYHFPFDISVCKFKKKELWGEANKVFMYHPSCDFRFSQNLLDGVVHLHYHLMTLEVGPKLSCQGDEC